MKKLFEKIRDLLRDRRFRKIWVRTVSSIACLVVFVTTYALVLPAITMESEAECGIEVHQHDESCYEERLICDLPESEGHVHTDDCYSTTRKLICDRSEHLHTSDCYDEEGNLVCGHEEHQHGEDCFEEARELVCGLEEAEGHSHDSSCYEKVLICGKEAHTHGPDCYREDAASLAATEDAAAAATTSASATTPASADDSVPAGDAGMDEASNAFGTFDPEEPASDRYVPALDELQKAASAAEETHPAVSFEDSLTVHTGSLGSDTDAAGIPDSSKLTVSVSAEAGTFPAGTAMVISAVTDMDSVAEAVEGTVDGRTCGFQAVDISFRDRDGNEIEPLKPISVTMRSDSIKAATEDSSMAPVVVHVEDQNKDQNDETAESKDTLAATVIETLPNTTENINYFDAPAATYSPEEISFEADAFSIYAIVYTVDFEYSVDGKVYQFSLPGGGFVSFTDLVEVLGIVDDTNSEKKEDKQEAETAENAAEKTINEGADASGENSDSNTNSDTNTALTLGDVEVTEATRKFVADVEKVEFSSPALVDVSRVKSAATVGEIKENRGLECEYSAELTEEQIAEINAQTVETGDWALISMRPFTSEETLTVTMKNGEVFTIRVTDYQISTNVLTADGRNYKITVTYDDDAEIPEGTKLTAEEIDPASDEYLQHLGQAWAEVNKEYLAQEEKKQKNPDGLDEYEDIRPVNLDDARFFSISLIYNKEEIEPKAPVHVDIEYVEGFAAAEEEEDQVIGVAHYKKEKTELITDVRTERNEAGEIVEFVYEQNSFSDIGTYVGQKTYDNAPYKMDKTLAMPLLRTLSNGTRNGNQLKDIEAHKRLTNNNDGTYTMSLTVKGDAVANEEYNKANILFVMDRSSSMTKNKVYQKYTGNTYSDGTTYYRKNGDNYEALFLNNGQVCTREWRGGINGYWGYTPYTGNVYTSVTRLVAEQAAMDILIRNLIAKNDPNTPGKEDLIEISVVSFAEDRQSGNTEYLGWTTNDYTGLMNAVNQTNTPAGTNWEDALIYAREQAAEKQQLQPDEDVYVIFLTDGEPTAVYGEHNGAQHYISNGITTRGGFEFALTENPNLYSGSAGEADGKNSLDRAKEIVDAGYKLYGIFTFNPGEAQTRYLRRLMNFAYTGEDKAYENDSTKEDTDIVKKYFTNADTPETLTAAFERIFADVSNMLGHGDVVITDGLQAADAMTTTIHANKADGFRYSVTDDTTGEELYYVTAAGNDTDPTVTFHINGQEYPAGAAKTGADGKPYYSVTVNGAEHKMALADLSGRELKWDLSAVGTLLPGCTYKVDIIVWPNQEAYDYVAGLNNKLPGYTWDSSVESNPDNYHEVTVDGVTYGYYTGGVSGHSSIVKYKDSGVFSVLTNTHQELNYSIVNTKTNEVTGETTTTSDPQTPVKLEPQKPMDLVDTNSEIEKQWNVDLEPSILAQLLYPVDGSHYTLTFDILQDKNVTPYKTISLGWDSTQNKYVWESESEKDIEYNGTTYSIGTTWKKDFAVPTGLMLSEERMDALDMDKSAYPSGTYPVDPDDPDSEMVTYYILEDGHDYTIKEHNLSYEFDFNADVFHPMLVDGKMQNVNFTKSGMKVNISNMTNTAGGLSSLKVENTLRGYVHLEKHVVDGSGKQIDSDRTKFEYNLVLTNGEGVFVDTHIPWYGINGLYYHDRDYNYYQVYYENKQLKIKNESGGVYPVTNSYDLNNAEEQTLKYRDGEAEKELLISGNQTTPSNGNKTASATLQISQGEVLSIANIPAGTQYTITESAETGYNLVKIDKRIDPDDVEEDPESTTVNLVERSITGTIVPNHHNYIEYTNRCLVTDITIKKTDTDGKGLEGAVFQLKKQGSDGYSESDASLIESVSGLAEITKKVNGETKTYTSAIESNGGAQTIKGLPDGTYRLYEVVVPPGYINTYRYIQFVIENRIMKNITTDTGDTSKLDTTANNIDLKIANEPGVALPYTGGPGTRLFTILGSFLILGAGALMWRIRRFI